MNRPVDEIQEVSLNLYQPVNASRPTIFINETNNEKDT